MVHNMQQPAANAHLQQHIQHQDETHRLELELLRREVVAEREKAALMVRTAEEKANESTARLDAFRAKFERAQQDHDLDRRALNEARTEAARHEKAMSQAEARCMLLEQRVEFVSRDRQVGGGAKHDNNSGKSTNITNCLLYTSPSPRDRG